MTFSGLLLLLRALKRRMLVHQQQQQQTEGGGVVSKQTDAARASARTGWPVTVHSMRQKAAEAVAYG